MKLSKWLGATGAVVALGCAGFMAAPAASAGPVTITADGGSVSCTITGSAKISPGLLNNWSQAEHSGANADPNANATVKAAMASIKDTNFAGASGTITTSVTAKIPATCTGTATQGTGSSQISTGVASATLVSTSTTVGDGTCVGLVTGATGGTTKFNTVVTWKGSGTTKINPTTVNATLAPLTSGGYGFELSASGSTDITGSFSGGTTDTKAYIDGTTLVAELGGPATFDNPTASLDLGSGAIANPCQPNVSAKFTAAPSAGGASDAISVKLKKPKSLKTISIVPGSSDPSTFSISG